VERGLFELYTREEDRWMMAACSSSSLFDRRPISAQLSSYISGQFSDI
jgi:hypothetical protein